VRLVPRIAFDKLAELDKVCIDAPCPHMPAGAKISIEADRNRAGCPCLAAVG
jgi:hypothetical protein